MRFHTIPSMPSLHLLCLASLHPAISLQYNQLRSFPHNSTAVRRYASHCQSFTSLYINVPNYAKPLRINALLLFAVPMPYNSIRYLSHCFSIFEFRIQLPIRHHRYFSLKVLTVLPHPALYPNQDSHYHQQK